MPKREPSPWKFTGKEVDLEHEVVLDSRGRRIDNAYVDRLVQSVHDQVARRGRPSLTGDHTPSPQVTFRLDPELKSLAEAVAASRGTSVSELARTALERFLSTT